MKEEEKNNEWVPIYEDKDGDWMLLGDVPGICPSNLFIFLSSIINMCF